MIDKTRWPGAGHNHGLHPSIKRTFRLVRPAQASANIRVFPPDFAKATYRLVTVCGRNKVRVVVGLAGVPGIHEGLPIALVVDDVDSGPLITIGRQAAIPEHPPAFEIFTNGASLLNGVWTQPINRPGL